MSVAGARTVPYRSGAPGEGPGGWRGACWLAMPAALVYDRYAIAGTGEAHAQAYLHERIGTRAFNESNASDRESTSLCLRFPGLRIYPFFCDLVADGSELEPRLGGECSRRSVAALRTVGISAASREALGHVRDVLQQPGLGKRRPFGAGFGSEPFAASTVEPMNRRDQISVGRVAELPTALRWGGRIVVLMVTTGLKCWGQSNVYSINVGSFISHQSNGSWVPLTATAPNAMTPEGWAGRPHPWMLLIFLGLLIGAVVVFVQFRRPTNADPKR